MISSKQLLDAKLATGLYIECPECKNLLELPDPCHNLSCSECPSNPLNGYPEPLALDDGNEVVA